MIVRVSLAYDGTSFRGWARNSGQRTVEGVLSDALARILGGAPKLSVAGRTDAGVHARGQVTSFVARDEVDLEKLQRSINGILAPEIVAWEVRRAAEGFDARFSATAREYRYRIGTGAWPDPFEGRFAWHRPGALALFPMREAARALFNIDDAQLELTPDPEAYQDAVRSLVTGPDSTAATVSRMPFSEIPWHLTSKCDGCQVSQLALSA